MKKNEIEIGGTYLAKVSGKLTTVRVDNIRETGGWSPMSAAQTHYDVTNLTTKRHTVFRSAAKFRRVIKTAEQTALEKTEQIRVCKSIQKINQELLKVPAGATGTISERLEQIPDRQDSAEQIELDAIAARGELP